MDASRSRFCRSSSTSIHDRRSEIERVNLSESFPVAPSLTGKFAWPVQSFDTRSPPRCYSRQLDPPPTHPVALQQFRSKPDLHQTYRDLPRRPPPTLQPLVKSERSTSLSRRPPEALRISSVIAARRASMRRRFDVMERVSGSARRASVRYVSTSSSRCASAPARAGVRSRSRMSMWVSPFLVLTEVGHNGRGTVLNQRVAAADGIKAIYFLLRLRGPRQKPDANSRDHGSRGLNPCLNGLSPQGSPVSELSGALQR